MTGPVQVLVVGFEKPALSGEILAELTQLGDAGIVRLLDVLLVSRTEDGHLETLPPPTGAHPALGQLATAFLTEANDTQTGSSGTDPTPWSLDDAVQPGGAAAVAFIEHTWAHPLVRSIRRAGGRLLDETWLAPDDLDLLNRLAGKPQ